MSATIRSPLSVTYAVWRALFLREAAFRLSARRAAWLWLLLEPVFHVAFISIFYELVRMHAFQGIDAGMFIMTGLLGFLMTRNCALRSMEAVKANAALFAYRQVRPVDTVIVRAGLEGFLGLLVSLIMLAGAGLSGLDIVPRDPLVVLLAFGGLWAAGFGLALMLSVFSQLVTEIGDVVRLAFMPLYLFSGIVFPIHLVPLQYREWLFYNPIVHGVEILRGGFFAHYHVVPEANLSYLYGFALVTIFLGLALHVRYARKIIAL